MKRLFQALEHVYRHPECLVKGGEAHEKSFEQILLRFGNSYIRHPNGSQAFPDFLCTNIGVELKSTSSNRIFLNDSFFVDGQLYVISTRHTSIISFGEDLYLPHEKHLYLFYKSQIDDVKKRFKDTSPRLTLYPRSANQYSIKHLKREDLWEKVAEKLKLFK